MKISHVQSGLTRSIFILRMKAWLYMNTPMRATRGATWARVWRKLSPRRQPHASGFTIIELLVVIAIVAVLIGILVPVLGAARRKARGVDTLSMMRQATAALTMYGGDHRDAFPFFATPGKPGAPLTVGPYTFAQGGYFGVQTKFWTALIVPDYLDVYPEALALHDTRKPPTPALGRADAPGLFTSRYWLTHAAHAQPAFWEDGAVEEPSMFRGMRLTDVAFPGQKGLLLDVLAGAFDSDNQDNDDSDTAYVGLADGSARAERWSVLIEAERFVQLKPYGAVGWPILSTRSGLAGTDFP